MEKKFFFASAFAMPSGSRASVLRGAAHSAGLLRQPAACRWRWECWCCLQGGLHRPGQREVASTLAGRGCRGQIFT